MPIDLNVASGGVVVIVFGNQMAGRRRMRGIDQSSPRGALKCYVVALEMMRIVCCAHLHYGRHRAFFTANVDIIVVEAIVIIWRIERKRLNRACSCMGGKRKALKPEISRISPSLPPRKRAK